MYQKMPGFSAVPVRHYRARPRTGRTGGSGAGEAGEPSAV